jgi:hypothetical protein
MRRGRLLCLLLFVSPKQQTTTCSTAANLTWLLSSGWGLNAKGSFAVPAAISVKNNKPQPAKQLQTPPGCCLLAWA